MFRSALLAIPLCLALAAAAQAGIKTSHYGITTGPEEYLTVKGGKLVAAGGYGGDERKAHPGHWLVEGGQIRNSSTRQYLTYDPADKEGKVFLADKPVKGAEWRVRKPKDAKRKNSKSPALGAEWGVIQASSGVLQGCPPDGEVGKDKGVRLFLRKEPKRNVEVARLYFHY